MLAYADFTNQSAHEQEMTRLLRALKARIFISYEHVRQSPAPEQVLMMFLRSTYNRAANLADWDRQALEREPVAP